MRRTARACWRTATGAGPASWLRYTQHKGRNSKPMTLEVPLLPVLRAAIDACPSAHLTFLVTERGQPFTSNGFGNKMKDWCKEAGLSHCSSHGLRKAGATLAAENGATERQLMAMFGWRTSKMAELYTRKAEQKRLAGGAMHLIDFEREAGSDSVPLSPFQRAGGTFSGKIATKSMAISTIGAQERTVSFRNKIKQKQILGPRPHEPFVPPLCITVDAILRHATLRMKRGQTPIRRWRSIPKPRYVNVLRDRILSPAII
nr:tyrosine-type recombinase/integrase [Methylobacterium soli]